MELPNDLVAAIESFVSGKSTREIRGDATGLSVKYRSRESQGTRVVQTPQDALAYVAFRLPATFAAAHASLSEVRRVRPDWHPRTLLDLGAGPGTVGWAATTLWPSIRQVTVVEMDPHMIQAGRELYASSTRQVLRDARWLKGHVTGVALDQHADLVTAAYVLGELPGIAFESTVRHWWSMAKETLVAIEPRDPSRLFIGYSNPKAALS